MIWGPGAVGNAIYTGCLLKDVLKAAGIDPSMGHNPRLHVAFESVELVIICMKRVYHMILLSMHLLDRR